MQSCTMPPNPQNGLYLLLFTVINVVVLLVKDVCMCYLCYFVLGCELVSTGFMFTVESEGWKATNVQFRSVTSGEAKAESQGASASKRHPC